MFPGGGGPGGFAADPQIVPAATPFSGGMFQQLGDRTGGGGGTPTTSSGAASAGDDVVRTIFVTGFPTNLNERELHNTVCNLPGYEASQVGGSARAPGFSDKHVLLVRAPPACSKAAARPLPLGPQAPCHDAKSHHPLPSPGPAHTHRGCPGCVRALLAGPVDPRVGGGRWPQRGKGRGLCSGEVSPRGGVCRAAPLAGVPPARCCS